jgi:polysaccharide biosynthesis/export protein
MFGGVWRWALLALVAAGPFFASDAQVLNPPGTTQPAMNPLAETAAKPSGTVSNASAADVTGGMKALDNKYKLGIGDRLSFRILEDEDEPKPLTVTDSGDLEVPYIGRCPAVGKTCKELANELKAELEKEYYYHATVIIAVDTMTKLSTKSLGKVSVDGAVHLPGEQEIPGDEVLTVSLAITRAGGFSDFADKRHVRVTRRLGPEESANKHMTVNVTEILEKGRTDLDVPLEAGDRIFVPDRVIRF